MNKLIPLAVATAAVVATGTAVTLAQPAGATGCSVTWGSQPKTSTTNAAGSVTAVRAGRHDCYDRLVLDNTRSGLGYSVSYVRQVTQDGSGAAVPLKGGAFLQVVDKAGATRRLPMPDVTGYRTFRQVAWAGSFEGYTTIGLGVRARLPFRVFRTGNHLVIDVAHTW
jgi:hypothetical protein